MLSLAAPHFGSQEKVDVRAGKLMCALSRYVPSLEGLKGLDRYIKAAGGGCVHVEYTDSGIGRLQIKPAHGYPQMHTQPRLRTMEGIEREWGTTRKVGGEIGRRAKGNRRRIAKESDWRQKRGETKARMLAF